jgi:hypothetical protein
LDAPFVRDWLGGDATEEDLHLLAGVPLGARITVSGAGRARLAIAALGQTNIINREGTSVLVRYQSLVHVPLSARSGGIAAQVLQFQYCTSEPGRTGLGTDAVIRMVSACEKLGLEFIKATLAGDGLDPTEKSTGYYAWAVLGFDAQLTNWEDRAVRPLPQELQVLPDGEPVVGLLDLFGVEGGSLWWQRNGSTILGTFDVENDSKSRRQLHKAVEKLKKERGIP